MYHIFKKNEHIPNANKDKSKLQNRHVSLRVILFIVIYKDTKARTVDGDVDLS